LLLPLAEHAVPPHPDPLRPNKVDLARSRRPTCEVATGDHLWNARISGYLT